MVINNPYVDTIYRQVVTEHFQSNLWREILINPEGASTTLRNESTLPQSGGHCFKDIPNRFIFWRVLYDKLELVEHSLDINLTENQVRIHFKDSPVLESGISVYETLESVVVLVPTACSCHRLTFPRPNHKEIDNENVLLDLSIFSDFNVPSIDDPATFCTYNAVLSHPYSAASCLDQKHDAIFTIALVNNIMLYIYMEYISGLSTLKEICQESAVPRMLLNISKVFSTQIENPIINSLSVHPFQQDIYVYSLDDTCELKVWSVDKSVYIFIMDLKKIYLSSTEKNGSRPHIIHKSFDDQLLFTIYLSLLESSIFVVLEPCTDNGMFKLQQKFYVRSPVNSRLVDMSLYGSDIWCVWRSGKDTAYIKSVNIRNGIWKNCSLDTSAFEQPTQYSSYSKQAYLDKIFSSSAYFTDDDLKNAIAVYDTPHVGCDFVTDYRTKIIDVIDTKVAQEMYKYDSSDIESQMQLIEQCYASFYKSCLDYRCKRLAPLGLIWLGSPSFLLVVVTNSSFCFLRPSDKIENKIFSFKNSNNTKLNKLLNVLMSEPTNKFSLFLDIKTLPNGFLELVRKSYSNQNSNYSSISLFLNGHYDLDAICMLIKMLHADLKSNEDLQDTQYSRCFRGRLGTSIISHSFYQIMVTRFDLCCRLFTFMELNSKNYRQIKEYIDDASNLAYSYWILALFSHDIKLCKKIISSNTLLAREPFMCYVDALLNYTWPLTDSSTLVEFLFQEKQYSFIQKMAQILNYKKWEEKLIISYMINNDPDKALMILKSDINNKTEHFLKSITQLEKYGYYEHAVKLGNYVLRLCKNAGDKNMTSMLHSNIFLNNLKLKAYKSAYNNILCLEDQDQKLNCLHTFVLTLLENDEKEQLLSFNFFGLQSSVEEILLKKARSVSNIDADPFYMFLCSMHDKYAKYKKLSMTFYELYLRADTYVAQEQYLRLSLLYLECLNPNDAWFRTVSIPFPSESDDHNGLMEIEHLKKLCWLARARQEIEESMTNMDVKSVISKLLMKHKFKYAMRLSKMWNLSLDQPLRALVKTCLTLTDSEECEKAWIWLADNGVSGNGKDSRKLAWRFLETLVDRYEEKGKTLMHYHVADELLIHRAFLPDWILRSFKERNVGELLQLYLSYGELINCADLILEMFDKEMSSGNTVHTFGNTVPVDIIECVIVNLKHNKLQIGDDVLNKYKMFYNKIVSQENANVF